MDNIEALRGELVQIFDGIKGSTLELKKAAELNNTVGKILSSLKVEIAYAALIGKKPNIPFLTRGKVINVTPKKPAKRVR